MIYANLIKIILEEQPAKIISRIDPTKKTNTKFKKIIGSTSTLCLRTKMSPLGVAASLGYTDVAKYLIETMKFNPDETGLQHPTPGCNSKLMAFDFACISDHKEVALYLLSKITTMSQFDDGCFPLNRVIDTNNLTLFKAILAKFPELLRSTANQYGECFLHRAVQKNAQSIIDYLLEPAEDSLPRNDFNAISKSTQLTPHYFGFVFFRPDALRSMFSKGASPASVKLPNLIGNPLVIATGNKYDIKHRSFIMFLLACGAGLHKQAIPNDFHIWVGVEQKLIEDSELLLVVKYPNGEEHLLTKMSEIRTHIKNSACQFEHGFIKQALKDPINKHMKYYDELCQIFKVNPVVDQKFNFTPVNPKTKNEMEELTSASFDMEYNLKQLLQFKYQYNELLSLMRQAGQSQFEMVSVAQKTKAFFSQLSLILEFTCSKHFRAHDKNLRLICTSFNSEFYSMLVRLNLPSNELLKYLKLLDQQTSHILKKYQAVLFSKKVYDIYSYLNTLKLTLSSLIMDVYISNNEKELALIAAYDHFHQLSKVKINSSFTLENHNMCKIIPLTRLVTLLFESGCYSQSTVQLEEFLQLYGSVIKSGQDPERFDHLLHQIINKSLLKLKSEYSHEVSSILLRCIFFAEEFNVKSILDTYNEAFRYVFNAAYENVGQHCARSLKDLGMFTIQDNNDFSCVLRMNCTTANIKSPELLIFKDNNTDVIFDFPENTVRFSKHFMFSFNAKNRIDELKKILSLPTLDNLTNTLSALSLSLEAPAIKSVKVKTRGVAGDPACTQSKTHPAMKVRKKKIMDLAK